MADIDRVILKGMCIAIPMVLQKQALQQLHINHIGIQKKKKKINKLLACKSIYWIGMNVDIENHIQNGFMCKHIQKKN